MQLIVAYTWKGRECRRFLQSLLLSGAADEIKKINYVHNYTVMNKKLTKNEEKLLIISYKEEQQSKLDALINKWGDNVKRTDICL